MVRGLSSVVRVGLILAGLLVSFNEVRAQQPAAPQFGAPQVGVQQPVGQQPGGQQLGGQPNQANANIFGPAGMFGNNGGGAANADFDSLIDLIQSTVEYDSWMENGSGQGEIQAFPMGVYADPDGTLRFAKEQIETTNFKKAPSAELLEKVADARMASPLRYVSLSRLERAIAAHQAEHKPLPPEMLTLAGLERIDFVMVNPETHDLILAGPAGDWRIVAPGTIVNTQTGRPVVRLDDLLALWRRQASGAQAFGCSIVPRQEALAATQEYLTKSAAKPIEPSGRKRWLTGLRDTLGKQDVEFFGVKPDSHMALVLLVADYHMKLVGMGLAESVPGVTNYLATVELLPDGTVPPMTVLRWWFAMTDRPVKTNAERDVFQIPTGGVQVLSENELLAARGQRVHTNQSEELNKRFADSFTAEFATLSEKYPVYGELQRVFDIALVLSLIDRESLVEKSGWLPALFEDPQSLRLPALAVPQEVETVINHRVINRRNIVAGISGGVWVDGAKSLKVEETKDTALTSAKDKSSTQAESWWWD
jgi:hypothetical protein